MKYVNYLMSITTGLCLAFTLGCTKAPVDVTSLGLKLSAPQLKSSSPFEQDMDSNGFVVLSGTCNKMMNKFSVSTDGETFYDIPPTTPYTIAGVSGTKTNKTDCADGTFEFYLSDALIESWIGSSKNIKKLFLRSEGTLGVSENLVLVDTKDTDGGSNATHLKISKVFPENFVGDDTCGMLSVSLTDSTGNDRSLSQAMTFSLAEVGLGSSLSFFTSMSECQNSVSAGTTINAIQIGTIPASHSRKEIYYHFQFPTNVSLINLRADNTSPSISLDPISTSIEKRDSSVSSTHRWLDFDGPRHIYKNVCIDANVNLRKYDLNTTNDNTHYNPVPIRIDSNSNKLKFYTDASCITPAASLAMAGNMPGPATSSIPIYYRYEDSTSTSGQASFTITVAPNGTSGLEIDATVSKMEVDLDSNRNAIAQLQIEGPNNIDEYGCMKYHIRALNARSAAIANSSTTPVGFNLNVISTGTSGFFNDDNCTSPISQENFLQFEKKKIVYFKAHGTYNSTLQASLAAAPSTSTQLIITVNPVATIMRLSKTDVTPSYTTLAAGYHFLCANNTTGSTACTGFNAAGQLGIGSTTNTNNFTSPIGSFAKMDAGYSHTCAIADGDLYCWGNNFYAQIGDNTTTNRLTPTYVGNDFTEVSGGYSHTCAITTLGTLKCWGANDSSQLGDGSTTSRSLPVQIGSTQYKKVSAGFSSTCAITTADKIHCWGKDSGGIKGHLGLGATTTQATPAEVTVSGETFNDISVASSYACAISSNNELYCWGTLLGMASPTPTKISGILVNKISSSFDDHSCLLSTTNEVYCWGNNTYGQVGIGTTGSPVTSLSKISRSGESFVDIVAGDTFTCGLRFDATLNKQLLSCWGKNYYGQFGIGTDGASNDSTVPLESHCYRASFQTYDSNMNLRDLSNLSNQLLINVNPQSDSAFVGMGGCTYANTATLTLSMNMGQNTSAEFYFRQKKTTLDLSFSLTSAPAYLAAPAPFIYPSP